MTYFVDPYKKYYDTLSANTNIESESESIVSKMTDINSLIKSLKSSLSSSGWKEMGIDEISNTTIPKLTSNIETLESNLENGLQAVATASINELLPLLTKLKEEDEKYEDTNTELNNLVVPVQYDKDGDVTAAYSAYIKQRNSLQAKLSEYRINCQNYKNNCDTVITKIKSLETAVADFKEEVVTSSSGSETATLTLVDGESSGAVIKVSYSGKEFYVVNTKNSVLNYEKYIQQNGLYQNAGLLGNQCMLLSQYYAVDLMRGTYTSGNTMANTQGSPATRINNRVSSENEDDVLRYIYSEVQQGRPTVLQVTQKRSNEGLRHLVTVVGVDSSVTSYKDLTPDKILVLDCVDGKVQTLSDRTRTLYNQGGRYQALGATQAFLAKEVQTVSQSAYA